MCWARDTLLSRIVAHTQIGTVLSMLFGVSPVSTYLELAIARYR